MPGFWTAASLKCIESALTGESEAVKKQPATLDQGDIPLGDRANMVFMGTSVAAGTGQAVVVATAMNTELGRIAGLIERRVRKKHAAPEETRFLRTRPRLGGVRHRRAALSGWACCAGTPLSSCS
jgi:magnesium-transporting ATPase (P-type)